MSATNLFINWTAVSFTPSGGSLTAIDKVTSVRVNHDVNIETFKGDLAKFVQAVAATNQMREITVTTGNAKTVETIVQGAVGSFTATLADAYNGTTAGGGAQVLALTNCIVSRKDVSGDHSRFASATITFMGYAADGETDPLTITAA